VVGFPAFSGRTGQAPPDPYRGTTAVCSPRVVRPHATIGCLPRVPRPGGAARASPSRAGGAARWRCLPALSHQRAGYT